MNFGDVIEVDSIDELIAIDDKYKEYKEIENEKN